MKKKKNNGRRNTRTGSIKQKILMDSSYSCVRDGSIVNNNEEYMQLERKTSNNMTEKTYRSLKDRISYSMIKQYIEDRQRFMREFVLGEILDRKETLSLVMGQLIDTLITDRDNFDNKFCLSSCVEPVGQMKILVDNLYRRTLKCMEGNEVTLGIDVLLEQAIQDTKYDYKGAEVAFKGKTTEKIIEMFQSDGELYYRELRNNYGKTVVSTYNIEKAELIANELRTNPFTAPWILADTTEDQDVFYQLAVLFTHDGMELKSLIDKLIVDHTKKTVQPLDLKSSWDAEGFSYSYTKHGYWLQASMYNLALSYWIKDNGLQDYKVLPMIFLVCDSAGYMSSLLYTLSRHDLTMADQGFSLRGRRYTGLITALTEIKTCLDTGRWNISPEALRKNGNLQLELNYD